MKIKTIVIKLSEEEKKNALLARTSSDKTWEDFFNRVVNKELNE